jgi:[protein-PII] uridylyltransferase
LERGLDDPLAADELIAETRSVAAAMLTRSKVKTPHFQAVWARFDADYFLRHSPEEIARQTRAIVNHRDDGPLVSVIHIDEQGTPLFVYCRDRDYLFAITTGVLAQLGLSILDARINTTGDHYTLDTYVVCDENGDPITDDYRKREVEAALATAIVDPNIKRIAVNRRTSRRNRHFNVPTQIYFDQADERGCTIMEIVTADRPGLLSRIGAVFRRYGILIKTAKVATIGERAEDMFFITDRQRAQLTDKNTLCDLRAAMIAELDRNGS